MQTVDRRREKAIMALNRADLGRVLRWTTGHCFLRYHNFVTKKGTSPDCRFCGDAAVESATHIVCECPGVQMDRVAIYGKPYLRTDELDSVEKLVAFLARPRILRLEEEEAVPSDDGGVSDSGSE